MGRLVVSDPQNDSPPLTRGLVERSLLPSHGGMWGHAGEHVDYITDIPFPF